MKGCVVSCCYHKKWYWNQNNWKIQLIYLDYYSDVFPKSRYPSYKLEIRLLFWFSRFQSLCLKTVSITTSSRNVLWVNIVKELGLPNSDFIEWKVFWRGQWEIRQNKKSKEQIGDVQILQKTIEDVKEQLLK